jgi:hypothetical protein
LPAQVAWAYAHHLGARARPSWRQVLRRQGYFDAQVGDEALGRVAITVTDGAAELLGVSRLPGDGRSRLGFRWRDFLQLQPRARGDKVGFRFFRCVVEARGEIRSSAA